MRAGVALAFAANSGCGVAETTREASHDSSSGGSSGAKSDTSGTPLQRAAPGGDPALDFGTNVGFPVERNPVTYALTADVARIVRASNDEVVLYGGWNSADVAMLQRVSENGYLRWEKHLENDSYTFQEEGRAVVDARGHTYFAGTFQGTLTVDGVSVQSVVNPPSDNDWVDAGEPSHDIALVELSPRGALVSLRTFGGVADQWFGALAIDPDGNLALAGTFSGRLDFGDTELVSSGGSTERDVFVAKLSPSGELLSLRQFRGDSYVQIVTMASDSKGGLVIGGKAESWLADGSLSIGQHPVGPSWVMKVSPSLEVEWTSNLGTADQFMVNELALDSHDDILLALDWSDGRSVYELPDAEGLLFAKLTADGDELYAKRGPSTANAWTMCVLSDDSFLQAGGFRGTVDFGGGPLTAVPAEAEQDAYVARFDQDGKHLWSARTGTNAWDAGYGAAETRPGRVAVLSSGGPMNWGDGALESPSTRYLTWITP